MGDVIVSKTVFFIGAWRTQVVTENLLQQISSQLKSKKGFSTTLTLTSIGLELLIHNQSGQVTRTDKIPLQNIIDFIGSKHSKTAIHAIVKDRQNQFTVFVFVCSSERDAGDMVQTFSMIKKRLSGEGYNLHLTPKGTNWMLKTKGNSDSGDAQYVSGVTVENTEKIVINGDNTEGRVGEVRVLANGDIRHVTDSVSHTGSELKDELIHLSDEVKAIKLMLEKNQPQTNYRVQQQQYNVVQEPKYEDIVLHSTSPNNITYQNATTNESNVIYHYETMADQPTLKTQAIHTRTMIDEPAQKTQAIYTKTMVEEPQLKTQTVYTKNHRYGSRRENQSGLMSGGTGYYVMRGRTDTGYSHAKSNISAANSMKSFYTRRRYDSPNPMAYKQLSLRQATNKYPATMRVLTTNEQKGVFSKHPLRKTASSDIVQKNIEDVYKHRVSFKKHVAVPVIVNPHATEYVNVSEVSRLRKENQMKIAVAPPQVLVSPAQREIVEEVVELKDHGARDGVVVVQQDSGLQQSEELIEIGTSENNIIFEDQKEYTVQASEDQYRDNVEVQQGTQVMEGGDVIVIKAETIGDSNAQPGYTIVEDTNLISNYSASQNPEVTYENTADEENDEKVIHIKAESAGQVRYVRQYEETEVIDTRTDEEKNEAERQNETGDSTAHVIIREEHIKPNPEFSRIRDSLEVTGEYNGEVRRITKNDKRVHYMEELNRNIGERRDSDIEIKMGFVGDQEIIVTGTDNNNDVKEEDAEVKYIMDTDRLKHYTQEPDIIIVEQDVNIADNIHQNIITENDLQRTEDTVLF